MGISIFSATWTIIVTLIITLILTIFRKRIVGISSGVLLKIVCIIEMLRAGMPFYFSNIRFPSFLYAVDSALELNTAIDYKIDYYAKDVFFENTSLRAFPATSTAMIIVFVIGVLLFFIYDFKKYYSMRFHMKYLGVKPDERMGKIAAEAQRKCGGKVKMTVYCHSNIPYPSVSGFLRPIVFIPNIEWTHKELLDLFEHEYKHFQHGDAWTKVIMLTIKNLNWWNIPIHFLFILFEWACEYHCDFNVTRYRKVKKFRVHYARTIAKALEHCQNYIEQRKARGHRFSLLAGSSAFAMPHSDKFALDRFEAFVPEAPRTKSKGLSVLIVLLALMLSISSVAFIPYESIPGVDVVHVEYVYFVDKEDGSFDMYVDGEFYENLIATRAEIESMGPSEYIFSEVPDFETVKQIGGN